MLPKNSPIEMPQALCSACGERLRIHVQKFGKSTVIGFDAYCDTEGCRYHATLGVRYMQSQEDAKYVTRAEYEEQNEAERRKMVEGRKAQEAARLKADADRKREEEQKKIAAEVPAAQAGEQTAGTVSLDV